MALTEVWLRQPHGRPLKLGVRRCIAMGQKWHLGFGYLTEKQDPSKQKPANWGENPWLVLVIGTSKRLGYC